MFESSELNRIFENEIKNGNVISEETDFFPNCKKLVILRKRFSKKYNLNQNLQYQEINDPHYWYAEYRTSNNIECLACKN